MAATATWKRTPALRAFPVICDGQETAFVTVIYRETPPSVGFRFWAWGKLWEVVQKASLTRGAVARPVRR